MMAFKCLALFFAFVVSASACRSSTTTCGGRWAATGYFGDAIREARKKIPNSADFRFRIPTSGTMWHQCGRVSSPGRLVQSAVQVYSKCDGCDYEAFGDEINCYIDQGLSNCGSGNDWNGIATTCNEYYCVQLTACLDN